MNILYNTPGSRFLDKWKAANWLVKDWQIGTFLQYASGLPLSAPGRVTVNNLQPTGGNQFRVPGVDLYTKDLACHCINPSVDQVLNPNAWTDAPAGVFGPGGLYGDFRGFRRPQENINFGRNFRIKERMTFQIRAEFVNMFNRVYLSDPSRSNAAISRDKNGVITSGFGAVTGAVPAPGSLPTLAAPPRTGTLVGRFTF
jgi:hypothetical protein